MKHILVTGEAGYIGSHMCKLLETNGFNVICFDNLSTGFRELAKYGELVVGNLADEKLLEELRKNQITTLDESKELIKLSEYAVEGRYATIHDDLEDANKYIKILEKLSDFVKKQIRGNQ